MEAVHDSRCGCFRYVAYFISLHEVESNLNTDLELLREWLRGERSPDVSIDRESLLRAAIYLLIVGLILILASKMK